MKSKAIIIITISKIIGSETTNITWKHHDAILLASLERMDTFKYTAQLVTYNKINGFFGVVIGCSKVSCILQKILHY